MVDRKVSQREPLENEKEGVLYIATGEEFVKEAIQSVRSLREVSDLPVVLASDISVDTELFDQVLEITEPQYSFGDQIDAMRRTPFEKTLYLDTDIYVSENPSDILYLLDDFDIAASQAPVRSQVEDSFEEPIPQSFPEYNTGVIGYMQNKAVNNLLDQWETEYNSDVSRDFYRNQPAFRRALYQSNARIATLPPEYNCRYQFPGQVTYPVKIFHGRLRSLNTNTGGAKYLMDIKEVVKKINSKSGPRVHYPQGSSVAVKSMRSAILYRILYSLKIRGVNNTLKRGMEEIYRKFN